jgi:hypothetical protein
MPKLYNTQTRREETLPETEIQNALLSGSHSYAAGERVNVKDESGEVVSVPTENLTRAFEAGYQLETASQGAVREYVDDNKGLVGSAKVALGQFADEALMGLPELIFDKTQDPLAVAKKEALKKEHEFANTVGGIAGFGASTLVGAPIFKGAAKTGEIASKIVAEKLLAKGGEELGKRTAGKVAKDIVARMATSATKMGVESAVLSAPRAITEAALGDPEAAGETMLAGVGLGAIFGAGGSLAKDLGKIAKNKVAASLAEREFDNGRTWSEIFKDKAEDKAVEALNPTLSQMERLENTKDPKKLGRFLLDEGVVTPLASPKVMYERLAEKTEVIGKEMGGLITKIDELNSPLGVISGKNLADDIQARVIDKYKGDIAYRPILKQIEGLAEEFKTLPWMKLEDVKRQRGAIDDLITNWGAEEKVKQRFIRETRNALEEGIEARIGAISPDDLANYKDLKVRYGYLEDAERIAKKAAAREAKNNDFGLTSFISMGAGGAVAGIPGAIGAFVAREGARRYGNQVMASMYDRVSGVLLAEQAMKRTAEAMDKLPEVLSRMSEKVKVPASSLSSAAVLRLMTGDAEVKNESADKRLERFTEKAAIWAADPGKFSDKISEIVSPISNNGAPEIGAAFNQKLSQAFGYLWSELPKADRPQSPFQKKRTFKPTVQQMHAFEQKAQVVFDPFSVVSELEKGTLSRNHVMALQSVYPKIYEMIRRKVQETAIGGAKPLSYAQRIKLSLLLDQPLDPSLQPEAITGMQATYFKKDETAPEAPATGQPIDLAKGYQSPSQVLAAK